MLIRGLRCCILLGQGTLRIQKIRQLQRPFIGAMMSRKHSIGTGFSDAGIQKFLDDFYKLMLSEALVSGEDANKKVCNFQQPADLEKILDMEITQDPVTHERLLELCSDIIKYSIKTGLYVRSTAKVIYGREKLRKKEKLGHPRFYNQLFSGKDPFSLAGAWLTDALNTNLHTYEVAPVFVVLEKYVTKKLASVIGFPNGDGVFCPGGSFSNILALHVARYRNNPDVKRTGMVGSTPLKLFTSVDAHYSLSKGASFLGFGTDSVIKTASDDMGRMDTQDLDRAIAEEKSKGNVPLYVMATCGTTVLGAFDDLNKVADVCEKHGVWMHIDAAWGGSVLFSEKHRHLMNGVERSDSVAWNPHKMSGVPIQCSALIMKCKGMLEECNAYKAEYLFQPDKNYDTSYDIGDKTIQCGRKADVLKLWTMWKAYGDKGMADRVDKAYDNASYLTQKLKETEGFRLVLPQCTNLSFWYIPPRLRGQKETEEWWKEISKVAPKIKARMMEAGSMMIGYQPLSSKGLVNFFRIIVENPLCDYKELDFVIEEIERLGKDL